MKLHMFRKEGSVLFVFFIVALLSLTQLLRQLTSISLYQAVSTTSKGSADAGDGDDFYTTASTDAADATSKVTVHMPDADSPTGKAEKKKARAVTDSSKMDSKMKPIIPTDEHDYDDYASWDSEYPLFPSIDAINAHKFHSSNCTRPDRILYLPLSFGAGLTDRTGKISILVAMACRLQAQVWVTPPHTMLIAKHNNRKKLAQNYTWERYLTFPTFVEEHSETGDPAWQACPENTLITMDESGAPHLKDKITEELTFNHTKYIDLKLVEHAMSNPNEPLFWNLNFTRPVAWNQLGVVYNKWKKQLPNVGRKCDAERLFNVADFADQVKQESLGGGESYLGIKLRRKDDIPRTGECTEAGRMASSVREVLVKRNFVGGNRKLYIFIMMAPEPEYKDQLEQALKSALTDMEVELHIVFESDSTVLHQLEESDNYLAYTTAYTILEDAPLGRIEVRRFDKDERYWGQNRTCGIRYAKTQPVSPLYKRRFLESGFLWQYHQIYPKNNTNMVTAGRVRQLSSLRHSAHSP